MVEAGLGLAAVPRMALPADHGVVIGLPLKNPTISRSLGLLTRHGTPLRPAAAMFHQHLSEALRRGRPPLESSVASPTRRQLQAGNSR